MVRRKKGSGMSVHGLPSTIRVGPYDIFIRPLPSESDLFGRFRLYDQEILLSKNFLSGHALVDTFIHELTHAIWSIFGLGTKATEEQVASAIAPHLTQVLRDHPEILHWMIENLTKSSTTSHTT